MCSSIKVDFYKFISLKNKIKSFSHNLYVENALFCPDLKIPHCLASYKVDLLKG